MRRRWIHYGLSLLTSATLLGASVVAPPGVQAATNVLYVAQSPAASGGGSCSAPDYNTIQAAVDGASAGDTIHICAGTYDLTATVTVTKDHLTFEGDPTASTIIDGGDSVRLFDVSGADLTVTFSGLTFESGNGASDGGGAIRARSGSDVATVTVNVENSAFSSNGASYGGAIYGHTGSPVTVTVTDSTFDDNTSWDGGAIAAYAINVTSSTFSGNSATAGGAIAAYSAAGPATVTATNSTFSGNSAYADGGAIYAAGTVTVTNSILAQASGTNNCYGTITDGGGNFSTDDSCGLSGDGTTLADLALSSLADNGGPIQTIALAQDSVAIDAALDGVCAADPVNGYDQRGVPRPQGAHCDAGAYEAGYTPAATQPKAALEAGATLKGAGLRMRLTWSSAGTGIVTFELARSRNGGAWTTVATALTAPAASVVVPSSGRVRYRVRTVDGDQAGAWATGPTLRGRLIQQTRTAISYRGSWRTARSSRYSGGSDRYATARGASATYRFTGRTIALVTTMAPTRGKVRIFINGKRVATVNPYRSSRLDRVVVWQRTWSQSRTRTIKLVVVGTSGRPRVDLDAFALVK